MFRSEPPLDPRGARVTAGLTSVVLASVLVTGSGWLALAQAAVFGLTAYRPRFGPYGLLYRWFISSRLRPPRELEPAAPVRFAQLVGLVCAATAAVGYLTGVTAVGLAAAAAALGAAFLNAAFGLCLGCEAYLTVRRTIHRPPFTRIPTSEGVEA